jgi:hypothetical protein
MRDIFTVITKIIFSILAAILALALIAAPSLVPEVLASPRDYHGYTNNRRTDKWWINSRNNYNDYYDMHKQRWTGSTSCKLS